MPRTKSAPRILFSNANLVETANVARAPHRPILSPRAVGKFATRVGCDGVDWQPCYPSYPGTAQAVAKAVNAGHIKEIAQHQSFNEEPYNENPVGLRAKILASKLGQKMIMPGVVESVSFMSAVQAHLGRKLPAVYFPRVSAAEDKAMLAAGDASMNLFQPKAHLLEDWGVDSAQDFQEEAETRGYNTCFDTHHGQRGGKFGLLLAGAAPLARAIHLSVARYDMPDEHVNIAQDFATARSGEYTGPIGTVFDIADEQGEIDYVVIEAPISGIMHATGYTAMRDIVQVYAEITDGIRDRYA